MATLFSFFAWRIPRDRGAQRATVYGVPKSQTRLKYISTRAQPAVGWCVCVCVRSGWGGVASEVSMSPGQKRKITAGTMTVLLVNILQIHRLSALQTPACSFLSWALTATED